MEGFLDERRKCQRKFPPLKYTILVLTIFSIATCLSVFLVIFKGNVTVFSTLSHNEGSLERHKNKRSIASEAQEQCRSVCTSPQCLEAASEMLSFMDLTVDPCDDFAAFCCGNRALNNFLPNFREPLSFQTVLTERMFMKIRETIETVDTENPESVSYKRKRLFDSCMKYARSADNGVAALRRWFARASLPDWPRQDGRPATGAQLDRLTAELLQLNENYFFQLKLSVRGMPDILRGVTEGRGRTFYPRAPNDTLLVDFILWEEEVAAQSAEEYRNMSVSLITMFGASEQEAHAIVDDMVEVQEIIKARSAGDEETILECFPENALNFQNRWCNLLREQLEFSNVRSNLSNSRIRLEPSTYFEFLDSYLNQESPRKQINFLSLKFIMRVAEELRLFKKPLLSESPFSSDSPEKTCMHWLTANLHYILTPDYIRQHQSEAYSEKALRLFQSVIEISKSLVQNATAFGETAQSKLMEMFSKTYYKTESYIEYFSKEFDSNSAFTKLQVSEEFISNVLAVRKFKMDEAASNPYSSLESFLRDTSYFSVQADASDSVTVYLGFLQQPAVGLERTGYLDYGHLGGIIAHEVAHLVYMSLYQFRFGEWSSIMNCLEDQYSQYQIPELEIQSNGTVTLGENFADNLGFLLMYKAYERYLESFGEEVSLPAVPFSNKQLLFIYLSQGVCEFGDKEAYKIYPLNSHSPAQQRILGSLKNIKEFAETFNCRRGTPMNPENKCALNFN